MLAILNKLHTNYEFDKSIVQGKEDTEVRVMMQKYVDFAIKRVGGNTSPYNERSIIMGISWSKTDRLLNGGSRLKNEK